MAAQIRNNGGGSGETATPGFGGVLAVVWLLGMVLVMGRRRN